jgi:iron complex outermembrane recepter protein
LGNDIDADKDFYVRGELLWKPADNVSLLLSADYTKLKSSGVGNQLNYAGSISDILNPAGAAAAGRAATTGSYLAIIGSYGLQTGLITPAQLGAVLTPPSSPFFNPAAFGAALPAFFGAEARFKSGIGAPASGFYDSNQGGPTFSNFKSNGFAATLTVDSGDITAKSITSYRKFTRDNKIDLDATTTVLLDSNIHQDPHTFSQEFQIAKNTDHGLDWLLGAYYSAEKGTDTSNSINIRFVNPNNPAYTYGLVDNKSLAFFAQAKYAISDQLRLTGGIRYTSESKSLVSRNRVVDFDLTAAVTNNHCSVITVIAVPGICQSFPIKNNYGAWDYLASIDFKPTEGLLFYARTARGFKSGGENLRGQDAASFAPFAPEVVTEYEVGAKLDLLDKHLRVNVSAYYDEDKNLQRSVVLQGPSGGLLTITTNAARATVKGFEAEVTAVPVHGLTLSATTAYTDAKYKSFVDRSGPGGTLRDRSNESFAVPKWTYTLAGTYAVPIGDDELRANLNWAYRGTSQLQPNALVPNLSSVTQRGYGLLGGRLGYKISSFDAEISVFGTNILKKKYYAGALALDSALGFNLLQPGRPRTFGVELKKNF